MPHGTLDDVAGRTTGSFGANFLVPFLTPNALTAASERARVIEPFSGEPVPALVGLVHAGGVPGGDRIPCPAPLTAHAEPVDRRAGEAMAQYAGQSVGRPRGEQPAAAIVAELAGGAEQLGAGLF